ncbi:MAG TPA: 6,7-dimethyl-8-ribityllumazine synthase [Candidatus Omnitrophota bacterium]|nr:6,7-dimethyl-8-ribityllumazine synthase [Candidatus Omnitrophota bacterium]HPD85077.1 6,7-dimethyl-8-ribityllumazine synthase [Candidatus Omnitrophota bacterium]HRZ03935.1 6,7-dimethyl-8-ribityllumazine synthase [Candidatus Omnitrophota bacterium]
MKIIEGQVKSKGKRYGIVVSRFNDFITKRLLDGCLKELRRCGVKDSEVTVVWVPGAFEIPLVARQLNEKKSIDAVICLGAVIRGETFHFDLVARAASEGIAQVALLTKKPAIFGVLTTETIEQAYKRSEEKGDHKGRDAARTAIEMVNLLRKI